MAKKLMIVCSSGGHFYQMYLLKDFWENFERVWVTFPANDTKILLKGEKIIWAHHPTNRHIPNLIKNFFLARKVLIEECPSVIVSTGAGVCVPFIYVASLMGIKTIYVESLTRITTTSLSGRMISPVVNRLFVQWPELARKVTKAKFEGQVI
jgi:beta-1,4-N-acetylglucosaminyltransferase